MKDWKTTLTGIGVAVTALLTTVAMVPNDTGMQYIPEPWRSRIIIAGSLSALSLRVAKSLFTADSKP